MGFNWIDAAEGQQQSEIMPVGYHRVKCKKIVTATKDGNGLTTKNGHPKIMAVVENEDGESATITFTLTDSAGWVLAQFLKHSGANLKKMQADGIEIERFADQRFAETQLIGRALWVQVTHSSVGEKTYANAEAVADAEVPAETMKRSVTRDPAGGKALAAALAPTGADLADEDIPF